MCRRSTSTWTACEQVLGACIDHGYALELNAAGLAGWQKKVGPPQNILYEYRRMGGERISIGSDSHTLDTVGAWRGGLHGERAGRRASRPSPCSAGASRKQVPLTEVSREKFMLFHNKTEITHAEATVQGRAKINLTLDVTGRRDDGYHTVKMVMQSVTNCTMTVQGGRSPMARKSRAALCSAAICPICRWTSTIWLTAQRSCSIRQTGTLLETCEIHIEKRIPVAAGLAGGSTDCGGGAARARLRCMRPS